MATDGGHLSPERPITWHYYNLETVIVAAISLMLSLKRFN
jgi:hypothetical protein